MFVQEAKVHQTLMDVAAPEAKRISAIRNVRNYTFHFHVDDYLNVIRDAGNPQEVRVVMAEALGWFTNSVQRPHILEEIKKMQQTANLPEDLKQSLNRQSKIKFINMNKYILLAITALCLQDMQAQTVVHPSIKQRLLCNCSRSEKL